MKSSKVVPAVGRQRQAGGLETILLWIIIAVGVAGVVLLYNGTEKRDTAALAAGANLDQPGESEIARLSNP